MMSPQQQRTMLGSVAIVALMAAAPARASEVDDLRAQLKAMQLRLDRLDRIEQDRAAAPPPPAPPPQLQASDQTASRRRAARHGQQRQSNSVYQPTQPGRPPKAEQREAQNPTAVARQSSTAPDLTQSTAPGNTRSAALQAPLVPPSGKTAGVAPGQNEFLTVGDRPGTFIIPGTNTSVGIHGFVSLQGFYDPSEYLGPKFQSGNISPDHSVNRRQTADTFHLHPKLTRFGFETHTPTPYGDLHTLISADAYGYTAGGDATQALGNYSYGIRLFHGYASIGRLRVGQFWSNFIDDPDQAETYDNSGPAGAPSERQPQIRWTQPVGFGAISVSAENPQASYSTNLYANQAAVNASALVTGTSDSGLPTASNRMPDLTAKYEIEPSWGHAQLSTVVRLYTYNDGLGHRASSLADGVIAGLTLNLNEINKHFGQDAAGFQSWVGNPGKYIPDDFGVQSDFTVNHAGTSQATVDPQFAVGGEVYIRHFWSKQFRSNLGFGIHRVDWADYVPAFSSQATLLKTLHANLIWSPMAQFDLGLEYIYGVKTFRTVLNIPDATAHRIEFGARFRY